jgi:hypothetical protein
MMYDIYAFADYSGATSISLQHKAIAWAVYDRMQQQSTLRSGFTRQTLKNELFALLNRANRDGHRVLFGFDHCYSFPYGFYQAVHHKEWTSWRQLLEWFHDDVVRRSLVDGEINPRQWAHAINQQFIVRDGLAQGPFWGPNFTPLKRQFTYEKPVPQMTHIDWHERRLVETRIKALKNIYQLGGAGSVGLQSLYGMYYIQQLLADCRQHHIPIHVWPYDGWDIPDGVHTLVEVYATLYLSKSNGKRTDQGDALACTTWATSQDEAGTLGQYLKNDRLSLTKEEEKRVRLEGWVLGV